MTASHQDTQLDPYPRFNVRDDVAVFLIALAARYGFFLTGRSPFSVDADDYVEAAAGLANQGFIFDPDLMPGYPVLRLLLGEGVLHLDIVMAAATAVLAGVLARTIFGGRWTGLCAGLGVAVHINLASWAGSGLTEPSATFFFVGGLTALYARYFAIGIALIAAALLTRPSLALIAPFVVAYFSLVLYRDSVTQAFKKALLAIAIVVALFSPWWLHNYALYDRFVPLNLAGGYTLYVGNNPAAKTGMGLGGIDVDPNDPLLQMPPGIERRQALTEAAIQWVIDNPGRFLELSAIRFGRFWHVESVSNLTVWALIQPYHIAFLAFLLFGLRGRLRETAPILLPILFLCAIHSALVSLPRYQFQVTPLIIALGVGWLAWKGERIWRGPDT